MVTVPVVPVPVTYFPKRCPHCGDSMVLAVKMHATWLECENVKCPALELPEGREMPFTFGYTRR